MSDKLVISAGVNNKEIVEMTSQEQSAYNNMVTEWEAGALDRSLKDLRTQRNFLLAETDYLALSDQTMTAEMTAYRQALRDITNGLTTVEDVEAVVWPEKPEA